MLAPLRAAEDPRADFLATYSRTTEAVEAGIVDGLFDDPDWVTRCDKVFAGMYLDAVDRWTATGTAPGPWHARRVDDPPLLGRARARAPLIDKMKMRTMFNQCPGFDQ